MNNELISKLIILKQRVIRITAGADGGDVVTRYDQERYIDSLPEPKSLVDRSYNQYLCQKRRRANAAYKILQELTNVCALFPCAYFAFFKGGLRGCHKNVEKSRAVFLGSPKLKDRFPERLVNRFHEIEFDGLYGMSLSAEDRRFVRCIWAQHPRSFLFVLKCAMKIASYADVLEKTGAGALIVAKEDSYTSSVLTEYCRRRNVEHINIMHGEIVYNFARTFFAFDECYVWDQHYADVCISLRAEPEQFVVGLPKMLLYGGAYGKPHGVTYYLQSQDKEGMFRVRSALEALGRDYRVRPHPIFIDADELYEVFDGAVIEDCEAVSIERSIMESELIISQFSTVLFQGYINGKQVVIDDVSNPDLIERMRDCDYIMLKKEECFMLGDLIRERANGQCVSS